MSTTAIVETGNVAGELPVALLAPGHWPNPRGPVDTTSPAFAELKASIEQQGILEPIVIGPPLLELDGCHAIIAGWRRYTAARALGLPSVPVHQRIDITDARAALRAALAENLAREDMSPLAEASAIARLIELGDTQVQAAAAVGVSERTARERLRLLELPQPVRDGIDAGHVPTTCTRQLQLIADVSPAAATAIAKKMQNGTVRAHDLLEPKRLDEVLSRLDAKAGLVKLSSYTSLKGLGLPAATHDALKARNAKAAGYGDGAGIDISPRVVGKELLGAAAAAGKLIRCIAQHGGEVVYLAGADWHEKIATSAVEHAEKAAAARTALRTKHNAETQTTPAPAGEDPELLRQDAQRARAAALDARARPHAAHMNAELGDRLRGLASCPIKGGVARVLIELGLSPDSVGVDFAVAGYRLVDPEAPWAAYGNAYDGDAYDAWEAMIRDASTPECAAAEIVKPIIACLFADPRADGEGDCLSSGVMLWRELELAARQAGFDLGVLPPRALALDAARIELAESKSQHGRQLARRRILFELDKVAKGRLERGDLATRAGGWGREARRARRHRDAGHGTRLRSVVARPRRGAAREDDRKGGRRPGHHHRGRPQEPQGSTGPTADHRRHRRRHARPRPAGRDTGDRRAAARRRCDEPPRPGLATYDCA